MNRQQSYILHAIRTPIGCFLGSLSHYSVVQLGSSVIHALCHLEKIDPDIIEEVYMGNVLCAGIGQAPARQAAIKGGLSPQTPAMTINKVCASGLAAVAIASDRLCLGSIGIAISGGMESMSNVPHYLMNARKGKKLGNGELIDGIIYDGLWDPYNNFHMGNAAEKCASTYEISREMQDNYATQSYKRAIKARDLGWFKQEITPLRAKKKEHLLIEHDEELDRVRFDYMSKLKPVFKANGSVTAANASSINDGASALLLVNDQWLRSYKKSPLASIIGYAHAAQEPINFTTTPALAIKKVLEQHRMTIDEIDIFEINEAFSVVCLANNKILNLDTNKVNIVGGAVSLGHPIGCSGARILTTLAHTLVREGKRYGCAAICNGGGGATAIIIENTRL